MASPFTRLDSLLRSAAQFGDPDACRELIAAGASPDATNLDGMSALHAALHAGESPKTCLALIEHADPKHVDWAGRTALHWAARYAPPQLIQALVDAGWDPSATDACGCTPLMSAASQMRSKPRMQLAHAIETLAPVCPIDARDDTGATALMMASESSSADRESSMPINEAQTATARGIQTILDAGSNPLLVDSAGRSALSLACSKGDDSSILQLLSRQAALLVDDDGLDPLMHACRREDHLDSDARSALISQSDLLRRNDAGFSALSLACSCFADEQTRHGSRVNPKSKAANLILDLARASADPDDLSLCIEILSPTGKSPLHDELSSLHDLAILRQDTPKAGTSTSTPKMRI